MSTTLSLLFSIFLSDLVVSLLFFVLFEVSSSSLESIEELGDNSESDRLLFRIVSLKKIVPVYITFLTKKDKNKIKRRLHIVFNILHLY